MDDRIAKVLQPLSEATATALEPLRIHATDVLFIWMTEDGKRFLMDIKQYHGRAERSTLRQVGWPSFHAQGTFERIPETRLMDKHDRERRWQHRVAATDVTALIVSHCWPRDQVQFRPPGVVDGEYQFPESEEAKHRFQTLLDRFFSQTDRMAKIAAFKESGETPDNPAEWEERTDRPLADYQRLCAQLVAGQDSLFITADRGTGKTAIAVQVVSHKARLKRKRGKGMLRVLIVCPPQVRHNWKVEFDRFATVAGKVCVIKGGQINRLIALQNVVSTEEDCAFSVGIVGYDTASTATIDQLTMIPWDVIISDESHKFKSSKTKRWQAMERLRDSAACRIPMTGTPIGNTPFDLWTQLEFCGKGQSGFETYSGFRNFYGKWKKVNGDGNHGVDKLIGLNNLPLLQERLARMCFQITKKEANLKLPDKVYDYHEVSMTKEQAEMYDQVATRLQIEIEDKLTGDVDQLTIQNILTQLLRLAQVTSGHVTYDEVVDEDTGDILRERRIVSVATPNPKVEAVVEMVTDEDRDPLGKTIVWCHFVHDIQTVTDALREAGVKCVQYYGSVSQPDRELAIKAFNDDPECRVMVCNPQTAGEGLNLVGYDWDAEPPVQKTYTDHEIFFSCGWSALDRGQAEDRAHRRGTRTHVRITDLVVAGSIDEEIRERVKGKQEMARLTLDIDNILSAVLGAREEVA